MHCFGSIYFTNGTRIKEEILWWRNAQIEYDAGRNSPGGNIIIITKVVEILNFKCQEEIFDELYYYRYRLWLHRFILSVLKKKAEERRQALAERPEYVTDIEYDELTSSWHINILSDNLEVTESITAKPVDLIECLNA